MTATVPGARWARVADEPPPEGVVVRTLSPAGLEQMLQRQGSLWFVPSGAFHVYYTPVYWRPVEGPK